jgi:hypothetical protein
MMDLQLQVAMTLEMGEPAETGTLTSVPYEYSLLGSGSVKAAVVGTAGNTLRF